ncbi:MAG: DUF5522 domain-containing protein [Pseudomonadota bacterium]
MSADEAHRQALEAGHPSYIDPDTGYAVFTRATLEARGKCCGCGCRHCPFQHTNVPVTERAQRIQNAAWLTDPNDVATIGLSWSGGKDSFLALRALEREYPDQSIALFTTFDDRTRVVAHQEIAINDVVRQASALGKALLGIPLTSQRNYFEQVGAGLELLPRLQTLAFGDLHLSHIRTWREACFAPLTEQGVRLLFPIWQVPYDTLMADFMASGARSEVSAVTHPALADRVGCDFGPAFVAALPDGVDAFGENGEFHTRIIPA